MPTNNQYSSTSLINIQTIVDKRFSQGDLRSAAYQAGWIYGLSRVLIGCPKTNNPFELGIAEADAWFSGNQHGRTYARYLKDDEVSQAASAAA